MQQSISSLTAAAGGVRLERVLGLTSSSSSDLSVNPITGHVAYPAGRIVVVYDPKEVNQGMAFRYLTLKKRIASLAWSACGAYLAVGERGRQPEITVWSVPEDEVTEIATPGRQRPRRRRRRATIVCTLQQHNFGVAALAFGTRGAGGTGGGNGPDSRESFDNWLLASAGFEHDKQIVVWKWMDRSIVGVATVSTRVMSMAFCPVTNTLVTVGPNHLSFWSHSSDMDSADESMLSVGDPTVAGLSRSPLRATKSIFDNEEGKITAGQADVRVSSSSSSSSSSVVKMKPKAAGVPPRFSNANFVGCCYDENGVCYVVTSSGTLCSVDSNKMMNKWVELDVKSAHSLSITRNDTSSKKGLLAIGCGRGVVRMFRPGTLQYVTTLPVPTRSSSCGPNAIETEETQGGEAVASSFIPSNILSVGVTGTLVCVIDHARNLTVWDVTSPKKPTVHRSFSFHSDGVWDIAVPSATSSSMFRQFFETDEKLTLPAETFYTCGADGTVRVWNIDREAASRRKEQQTQKEGDNQQTDPVVPAWYNETSGDLVRTVLVAPVTKSSSEANDEKMLTMKTKAAAVESSGSGSSSSGGIRCMAFSPDGAHLATGDRAGHVRVHDLENGLDEIQCLKHHTSEIMSMEYSPVPPPLAGLGDSVGKRVSGRSHVEILAADDAAQRSLLVSAGRDRIINVHDASPKGDYLLTNTLKDHSASVTAVRFAMDGSRLYSCGGDRTIVISRVKRRDSSGRAEGGSGDSKSDIIDIKRGHAVAAQRGTIHDMRIHPNNRWVVTSGHESKVQIWSSFTGKKMRNWSPTDAPPRSKTTASETVNLYKMHLDATGTYAATCSFDRCVRIYDFLSGDCLASFSGHSELVTAMHFTADDRRLISVGADGCVMIWRLPTSMTRAMRSRRAEIRRNCLLQLEREREGREEEEKEKEAIQTQLQKIVASPIQSVIVEQTDSIDSADSIVRSLVVVEEKKEIKKMEREERERTLRMVEASEKALASMAASPLVTCATIAEPLTSPIAPVPTTISTTTDDDNITTAAASTAKKDEEWLRKSTDAIAACLPSPILDEDAAANITPPSSPSLPAVSPAPTNTPTSTYTSTTNTIGLGRSDLPSWAKTKGKSNGKSMGSSSLPSWAKTVTEMPHPPTTEKNKNDSEPELAVVGVNRWAEKRQQRREQNVQRVGLVGRSYDGSSSLFEGDEVVDGMVLRQGSQSVPSSPVKGASLSRSQRNVLASSYEETDFVRLEDDNDHSNNPTNGSSAHVKIEESGAGQGLLALDGLSGEKEKLRGGQTDSGGDILILPNEKKIDNQNENHVNGINDTNDTAPISTSLRTSSERSLLAERQAMKLKERQKKTSDAVNNMRKRLAAMGIVKEDPVPVSFNNTAENVAENIVENTEKNEAKKNEFNDNNDPDVLIDKNDSMVSSNQPAREEPPRPTIDTMDTLSGPKQSPVSPTVR
jgi:WD40 repeat protein